MTLDKQLIGVFVVSEDLTINSGVPVINKKLLKRRKNEIRKKITEKSNESN